MAAPEYFGYPVPYDGHIDEMVVSVTNNTCDADTYVDLYKNPFPYVLATERELVQRFSIPALTTGAFHFRPKKKFRFKKFDLIVVPVDTSGSEDTQAISLSAAISYKRNQNTRHK